ncbi:hypothetical protein J7E99_32050 [Streptomyces sp. ISL-44]|uniref:WD40 repeat domain-containing protein n=1 Tax=Streptomyces sp. ISL-44 TaxID=2819184 RepID=UPI001BE4E5F7|nr:hypothetical protein [Streptomyces sp. ISL-44]MBT2545214.1 hypothetical protein [Streptomyces sp. ISL-44]
MSENSESEPIADLPGEPTAATWTADWASGSCLPDRRLLGTFTGHDGPVTAVGTAIVGGRPVAVSGSRDNTVRIWDVATGVQLHDPVTGHTDPVSSVTAEVLSVATAVADGKAVALTLHADEAVLVWDLATGREAGEFVRVVEDTVLDGRRAVLTLGAEGTLRVWDPLSGRQVNAFPSAIDVATLDDGRRAVVTLDRTDVDRTVEVWDLARGRQVGESLRVVRTVDLDGRMLALTAREDGAVLGMWDLATGHPAETSPASPASPDLSRAAEVPGVSALTVVQGRAVALGLDDEDPEFIGALSGVRQRGAYVRARETTVSGGRTVALATAADGSLRIWDLTADGHHTDGTRVIRSIGATGQLPSQSTGTPRQTPLWHLLSDRRNGQLLAGHTGHTGRVWDVATTVLDGRPVAVTAGADHTLRVWDLGDSHTTGDGDAGQGQGHSGPVLAIATAVLDGRPVAVTAGADHTLRTWDLATGRSATAPVTGPEGEPAALATAVVDGRVVIVTAGPGAAVQILDPAAEGDLDGRFLTHHDRVLAMATATLDGRPVAVTAGSDRTLAVWDLTTRQRVGEPLAGHSSRVTALATAVLEGRPVAVTGSWDKTVRLWDLGTGRQIGEPLTGHTDWVTAVATAVLDGRVAAISKSRDGTVRLWDLATLQQIGGAQTGHKDSHATLAVTVTDGRPVVAIGHERSVRFWDLATGREAADDHLLPLPVGALTTAPDGRLVVAYGPDLAVLSPAPLPVGNP